MRTEEIEKNLAKSTPGPWYYGAGAILWSKITKKPIPIHDGRTIESYANAVLLAKSPSYLRYLLDRVRKLEAWAKADRDYESMDCPHESEHRCDCGLISNELWAKCRALRETALEREGGSDEDKN